MFFVCLFQNTPAQNILKRPNQQPQSSASRNSNLRELPIAPLHAIETANNNRQTPASSVPMKPVSSITAAMKPLAGIKNQLGKMESKPKTVTPTAEPKVEVKSEPEVRAPSSRGLGALSSHLCFSGVLDQRTFAFRHSSALTSQFYCLPKCVLFHVQKHLNFDLAGHSGRRGVC